MHGLLEGIARIECEAYTLLKQLGATPVTRVICIVYLTLQVVRVLIHAHAQPGSDWVIEQDEDGYHICMSCSQSQKWLYCMNQDPACQGGQCQDAVVQLE